MKILFLSVFALLISLRACSQGKSVEVIYTKAYKHAGDTSAIAPRPLKNLEYRLSCSPTASRFEKIASILADRDDSLLYKVDEFSRFLYIDTDGSIYYKNTNRVGG